MEKKTYTQPETKECPLRYEACIASPTGEGYDPQEDYGGF